MATRRFPAGVHIGWAGFAGVWALLAWGSAGSLARAERLDPHEAARQVDAALTDELGSAANDVAAPAPVDDETFLRRAWLDLVGHPPAPDETTLFVLDPAPDKRARLVERLLADPRYGENLAHYWRDVIFHRRADNRALLAAPALTQYLTDQFNAGAGWDAIARSFVTAAGPVREQGETALILAQMSEAEDVAAETSRIFLGVQIQCAQCHDHPTDRWRRRQFHELAAFFSRVRVQRVPGEGNRTFQVVGQDQGPRRARPNGRSLEHYMPDLEDPAAAGVQIDPAFFLTSQALEPARTDADRRQALADWMTSVENPWFARALVNRVWAELIGRGFYEPVDDLGPDRECAAPETLNLLAAAFIAAEYDLKWLYTAVLATDAYQRQVPDRGLPHDASLVAACPQRLRSDQLYAALAAALEADRDAANAGRSIARLAGPRGGLTEQFGFDPSLPRDEVNGSVPQALLLMNSPVLAAAIDGAKRNTALGQLLAEIDDDRALIDELYLRCFARRPSDDEQRECLAYLAEVDDRRQAMEDILWALVNSTEFLYRK